MTTPLTYLKRELNFNVADWNSLTDKDKADLKEWAREEMAVLGILHFFGS